MEPGAEAAGRAGADAAEADDTQEASATDSAAAQAEAGLAALAADLASAKDAWLRAEADLQNVRRRTNKEVEEAESRAVGRMLLTLVTFADDLERALEAARQAGEKGPLAAGVELVLVRLLETLRAHGVEPIDPAGEAFDPHEHEALLSVPSETCPAGTVAQVIARGYRHGGRLLRPARVMVSSGPEARA